MIRSRDSSLSEINRSCGERNHSSRNNVCRSGEPRNRLLLSLARCHRSISLKRTNRFLDPCRASTISAMLDNVTAEILQPAVPRLSGCRNSIAFQWAFDTLRPVSMADWLAEDRGRPRMLAQVSQVEHTSCFVYSGGENVVYVDR